MLDSGSEQALKFAKEFSKIKFAPSIVGHYSFTIFRDGDWYLAQGAMGDQEWFTTQGRTEEEIFDMLCDAYLTAHEIKISWWNRLLWKLRRYK